MSSLYRSLLASLAAALVLTGLPARAAEVDKYLPNDTQIVFHLNVQQIMQSPLLAKHHVVEELRKLINKNDQISAILKDLGFDPFKDLTSLTAAANGMDQNSKGLLIAHGHFDVAKFEARAKEEADAHSDILKVLKEGSRKIYEVRPPNEEKPVYVALADGATLVASNDKSHVLDALERSAGNKQGMVNQEVRALIEKEQPDQSVWVVAPGSALNKSELTEHAEDKTKETLKKIDSIRAGLTIAKDIRIGLSVVAKTAKDADELAAEIKQGINQSKGLVALMAGEKKELAPVVDALGALKVATDGKTVTVKADVTEETIEKGLQKQRPKE